MEHLINDNMINDNIIMIQWSLSTMVTLETMLWLLNGGGLLIEVTRIII